MDETNMNNEQEKETVDIDKHQKFQEQSVALIKKAIVAIENLGKVSNQRNFEYTDEEVERMFAALEESIEDTKHMFKKKKDFSW